MNEECWLDTPAPVSAAAPSQVTVSMPVSTDTLAAVRTEETKGRVTYKAPSRIINGCITEVNTSPRSNTRRDDQPIGNALWPLIPVKVVTTDSLCLPTKDAQVSTEPLVEAYKVAYNLRLTRMTPTIALMIVLGLWPSWEFNDL
jgi:hypothetical protein